jgi:hypothetical protein
VQYEAGPQEIVHDLLLDAGEARMEVGISKGRAMAIATTRPFRFVTYSALQITPSGLAQGIGNPHPQISDAGK